MPKNSALPRTPIATPRTMLLFSTMAALSLVLALGAGADAEAWTKLGDGFCFASEEQERLYQINEDWVVADLATAKAACKANAECVGLHYDTTPGDYLLLSRLGTPDNFEAGERACYKLRENPGRVSAMGV